MDARTAVKVGDAADNGELVESIIYRDEHHVVYLTKSGKPGFECSKDLAHRKSTVIRRHDELVTMILLTLHGRRAKLALTQLGYAMNNALLAQDDDADTHFGNVMALVVMQSDHKARIRYALGSLLTTCVIAVTSFSLIVQLPHELWWATLGGSIGALVSVLQRAGSLSLPRFSAPSHYTFQGALRVVLGSLFGMILGFLCSAGYVLANAKQNVYELVSFSIVAGINERFVKELLQDLAKRGVGEIQ